MGTMVPLPAVAGNPVRAVAVSRERVAALCDGTVYLGTLTGAWRPLGSGAVDVVLRGDHVYTARDRSVVMLDPDGREIATIGPTATPLQGFAVKGEYVALGAYREVSIWAEGRCVASKRLHDGTVPNVAFAPNGDEVVTRRNDEFALWPWRSRWARVRRVQAGEGYGSGFAFLPDGRMIGALGRDRLGIWSARGKREDSLQSDDWVRSVCAAPDGTRIAARLSGGGVLAWALPDGERTGEHEASLLARGIAFTPDGSTLITGDDAALMTWGGDVPEPDGAAFMPTFPARFPPRPATPLLAAVESIPWLAHADLDAWPGPEDPAVSALNRYEVELAAPVERAIRGLHRDDVRAHAEEIGARVRASTNVPYDPDEDPWHPPTAAVALAVYVAETLAGYVGLGWPVPDDLRTLWAWYETGRWPGAISDGGLIVY